MTKTEKTPLMTAELCELSYWSVTVVPESELSHTATAHYSFVLKLSRHGGKNIVTLRFTKKIWQ